MDKTYKIIPLNNQEYAYLVILCNASSPYDYMVSFDIKIMPISFGKSICMYKKGQSLT